MLPADPLHVRHAVAGDEAPTAEQGNADAGGYPPRISEHEPTTEALRIEQLQRELAERRRAGEATSDAEERAAERRADKAAYLREKLDEQAANPDAPG